MSHYTKNKPKSADARNYTLYVRLNPDEQKMLSDACARTGMSMSAYLRSFLYPAFELNRFESSGEVEKGDCCEQLEKLKSDIRDEMKRVAQTWHMAKDAKVDESVCKRISGSYYTLKRVVDAAGGDDGAGDQCAKG